MGTYYYYIEGRKERRRRDGGEQGQKYLCEEQVWNL